MTNLRAAVLLTVIAGFLFSSCGYRFAGGGDLPGAVKRVNIAVLENKTAESGIENVITNDIIYEFIRNGRAAAKIDDADAYLTGIIESANDEAISRQSAQTSLERRITVILSLKLKDKSGKIIWSRKSISADQAFAVTADKYETEKNKSAAIELLSKRLAENVYNRLTDNF